MARKYFDKDADLKYIEGKTVAVLGYGNQGRSQALNLRDSGINVIIGSPRKDDSEEEANNEGFKVLNIKDATAQADILMLLLPDEILPQIYKKEIKPYLKDGMVLSFASGYNVYYKMLDIPEFVDVVMVAPRMIGREVRELFLEGSGAPSLISVEQDSTGNSLSIVLALAKGIGATRVAVLESSCEEETIIDLMGEQAMGGSSLFFTRTVYEVLSEAGCSPEAILMELYASGENIAVAKAIVEKGMWNQLRFHSHTSQYGHQTRGKKLVGEQTKDILRSFIRDIKDGSFRDEWTKVQQDGMKEFDKVWEENLKNSMLEEEDKLYKLLGRRK